jgi:hypothetical protein
MLNGIDCIIKIVGTFPWGIAPEFHHSSRPEVKNLVNASGRSLSLNEMIVGEVELYPRFERRPRIWCQVVSR